MPTWWLLRVCTLAGRRRRAAVLAVRRGGRATGAARRVGQPMVEQIHLQSKRLLIESRWVSKPLAFAGELRPRRLNN
jgi:hypothetical protein